jgi:hypothetical protein
VSARWSSHAPLWLSYAPDRPARSIPYAADATSRAFVAAAERAMNESRTRNTHAPLWLRGLILAVVLWLAVKIVGNVTESLTGMVEGGRPAPTQAVGRGF